MSDAGWKGLGPDVTPSPDAILRKARGITAETVPATSCGATGALVSGQASFVGIALRAGDVVTNIGTLITGAVSAVGVTLSKVGLYDKNGNRLAVSADQGTSWQTIGYKTIAMIAPYVVPATDIYYAAVLCVFTTTGPTFARGAAGNGCSPFAIAGFVSQLYGQLALADLPNPATYSLTNTSTIQAYYLNVT